MQQARIPLLKKYHPLLSSKDRYIRLQGGAGSGKSIAVAQYLMIQAMGDPGHRIFAFRKVGRTVKNSIIATFQDLIRDYDLKEYWAVNKTERTFTFLETGVEIICGGVDDPEKVKSIKAPTIIWMEEATEFTYNDFTQLNLRLRKYGITNQLIMSYNPISTENWIHKRLHIGKELHGQELYIQSSHTDNLYIPDASRESLVRLALTNENAYKVYTLGEWANLTEGLIFPTYTIVDEFPVELMDRAIYGLDFGFVDPMALVRVGISGQDLYVQELFYRTGETIEQLVPHLNGFGVSGSDRIYCDSARPGDIQSLYNAGFRGAVPAVKGQGSILSGIRKLHEYKLHVTSDSINLISELGKYCWMKDKADQLLEKPIDDFNHSIDALRYAVYSHTYKPSSGVKKVSAGKFRKIQPYRP